MERFANFLRRLETMKDPDGTSVLHNSMIGIAKRELSRSDLAEIFRRIARQDLTEQK